jgi:hypothetical protein
MRCNWCTCTSMRMRREVSRVNLTVCVPQVTTDLGLGFGSNGADRCVARRPWSTKVRASVAGRMGERESELRRSSSNHRSGIEKTNALNH